MVLVRLGHLEAEVDHAGCAIHVCDHVRPGRVAWPERLAVSATPRRPVRNVRRLDHRVSPLLRQRCAGVSNGVNATVGPFQPGIFAVSGTVARGRAGLRTRAGLMYLHGQRSSPQAHRDDHGAHQRRRRRCVMVSRRLAACRRERDIVPPDRAGWQPGRTEQVTYGRGLFGAVSTRPTRSGHSMTREQGCFGADQ